MERIDLGRRRVLVVEDEPLLAFDILDQIEQHNGIVIGPVGSLQRGLKALDDENPDACIVNIQLGRDLVYELADKLVAAGIPFIFASSLRREDIPERFKDVPLHSKPIDMIKAAAGLITYGAIQ